MFAFIAQFLITGVVPDILLISGALLIILGVIILAFQKKLTELQSQLLEIIKKSASSKNIGFHRQSEYETLEPLIVESRKIVSR